MQVGDHALGERGVGHFVDAVAGVGRDLGDERRGTRTDQFFAEKAHVTQPVSNEVGIGYIQSAPLEERLVVNRDKYDVDRVKAETGDGPHDRLRCTLEAVDRLVNRKGNDNAIERAGRPAAGD
jgi:hypothetical protein